MARDILESNGNRAERQECQVYANIAANAWNQSDMRSLSSGSGTSMPSAFGNLELIAQSKSSEAIPTQTDLKFEETSHSLQNDYANAQPPRFSDISKSDPNYRQLAKEYFDRQLKEAELLAETQKEKLGHSAEAPNQELKNKIHHWKIPGKDDDLKRHESGYQTNSNDLAGPLKNLIRDLPKSTLDWFQNQADMNVLDNLKHEQWLYNIHNYGANPVNWPKYQIGPSYGPFQYPNNDYPTTPYNPGNLPLLNPFHSPNTDGIA